MSPKIIRSDQKGFMKGRYIGEDIRLLYNVLSYTETEKQQQQQKQQQQDSCLW